jgi:hypothetical protein
MVFDHFEERIRLELKQAGIAEFAGIKHEE